MKKLKKLAIGAAAFAALAGSAVLPAKAAHASGAITVTASSTNSANGINLKVLVLDNAQEAGGAGSAGTTTTGPDEGVVTPNSSGSYIAFALADGTSTSTFTPASGNSFFDNHGDTTNFWAYGDGHYTGTVTAGTPVTVGATAPTGKKQAGSAYEIRPSGSSAPTLDASTPASAFASAKTVTSASFTPPAGSTLVAEVEGNAPGSGSNIAFSLSDSSGLTWTQREPALSNAEGSDIYTATVPSGGGSGKLTWSPPTCGDATHGCVDLNLSNTGSHQTPSLSNSNDYRLHLPTTGPLVGGITILGGHNVQVIGGEIDLTYPCANDASNCMGFYDAKGSPGDVYLEGVWIHNPSTIPATCSPTGQPCSTGDGMDVNNNGGAGTGNITLQNDRIDGISGCSGGGDHADVLQPYAAQGNTFRIDHLTGTTNCQGLQIDPDLAGTPYPTYDIRNANIDVNSNPYLGNSDRYGLWFTDGCTSGSVALSNVYEKEPDGSLANNAVWPDPAQSSPANCGATYSGGAWHPGSSTPQITGVVTSGQPTGGDYVPAGTAGIGYVSPGYQ